MEANDSIEIDLGKYIEVLFRQWQLILGTALLFAGVAAGFSYLETKSYQASALVATIKSATEVSFGSGIETLSEEQLSTISIDPQTRLESYANIVDHPDVAQAVLEEVGEQLPEEDRSVAKLLDITSGEVAGRSDLIEIVVTYHDPVLAAEIANAWSRAYVEKVNSIYSGGETQEAYLAIQGQTIEVRASYDEAQASLESFIKENQVDGLKRKIAELESLLDGISEKRSFVMTHVISDTAGVQLAAFDEQINDSQERLVLLYAQSRKVEQLLRDVQDMYDQVEAGGTGAVASNALAITLLKTQFYAANEEMANLQIQLTPANLTVEEMLADLEALISILEARKEAVESEIEVLSKQLVSIGGETAGSSASAGESETQSNLLNIPNLTSMEKLIGSSEAMTAISQEAQSLQDTINELKARLAKEEEQLKELTWARNLAWGTYQTLATKQAELKVALQARGTEVALASPATVPSENMVSINKNVALAAVVGAILGIGLANFIEFWWCYQGIEPKAITIQSLFQRKK